MADVLAGEIDGIVNSPYPVSLKRLHDLVRNPEACIIQKWSDSHADQVEPLALTLLEALEIWPYAPDLLRIFCVLPKVRDAVLLQSPMLLETLLGSAIASTKSFTNLSGLCVALLKAPLPSTIALPASAQNFLNQLFNLTVQSPLPKTVEPVYDVLRGACEPLLDMLPAPGLTKFREHFTRMLRSAKGPTEQSLNLYCLAILGRIHLLLERRSRPSTESRPVTSSDPSWTLSMSQQEQAEISSIFSGERVHKTVVLVVCQVMFACGTDNGLEKSVAIRQILLAREIINAVDPLTVREWAGRQSNHLYIQKLHQKACDGATGGAIQIEAIAFVCALCETEKLPSNATTVIEKHLLSCSDVRNPRDSSSEALSASLPVVAARITSQKWAIIMEQIFHSVQLVEHSPLSRIENFTQLLNLLRSIVPACKALRTSIVEALATTANARQLQTILDSSIGTHQSQPQLLPSFLSLLLSSGLCACSDEPSISSSLVMQLLDTQQQLANRPTAIRQTLSHSGSAVRIASTSSAPGVPNQSRHWKDHLYAELDMQAKRSSESVVQLFGQTCRDMEDRCHNLEEPLRQAQALQEELRNSIKSLEARTADLDRQASARDAHIGLLEKRDTERSAQLTAASDLAESQAESMRHLESQLHQVEEEAKQHLSATKDAYEAQLLQLRAATASHAEKIEDVKVEKRDLQSKLDETKQTLEAFERSTAEHEAAISQIRQQEASLNKQVDSAKSELGETQDRLHANQLEAEKAFKEYESAHATLQSEHEGILRKAREEAAKNEEQLQARVSEMTESHQSMLVQHETAVQDKDKSIADLKRKCRHVTDSYRRQGAELSKAQEWRTRVMSVMGGGGIGVSLSQAQLDVVSASPSKKYTRTPSHRLREAAPPPATFTEEATSTPDCLELEASFDSQSSSASAYSTSGPSPKRPKPALQPRKAFKVPFHKDMAVVDDIESPGPVQESRARTRAPLNERTSNAISMEAVGHDRPVLERRRSSHQSKPSMKEAVRPRPPSRSSRKSLSTLFTVDAGADEEDDGFGLSQSQAGQENHFAGDANAGQGIQGFPDSGRRISMSLRLICDGGRWAAIRGIPVNGSTS